MFLVPLTRRADWLRSLDRFFDGAFDGVFAGEAPAALPRTPALDVSESEQAYTVTLDLPGVAKDNVKVTIEGRRVQVEAQAAHRDERKESDRVVYRERAASSYARSFVLPVELDQQRSTAKLDSGVLKLELAKRVTSNVKQIAIN